ncbi:Hypothetical predicted protein [Mytilus galloprovincialis]|uniref:Uncharacterized protein n=1 Tax=Mytilus galloprovincialis TaxID=29158 RepID=A0A8B6HF74_MYTGA|nr:Hypothetical predicted protein [Mytilus galloprovincialis]
MSRCTSRLSDSESDNDDEILKLFASDEEVDASFSGFSQVENINDPEFDNPEAQILIAEDIRMAVTQKQKQQQTEKGKKSTSSTKGKALASKQKTPKRQVTEMDNELPSGSGITVSPVKKRGKGTKATKPGTGTVKKTAAKNQLDQSELLKTLFKGLSDTLVSTLSHNNEMSSKNIDNNMEFSENESDEQVIDTHYNIFSDEENEPQVIASDDEFDYELPKIFEDDEKYDEEVSASLAKVFDNICKKKSDVSVMTREMKIPVNCKSLVAPPVNAEIWQFLERKAKTADLNLQTIQKSLGCGMVPLIRVAEILKSKTPDVKLMRENISKALAILSNTHFELSIKRRMSLKPHIDKKYHQLCNRNEDVGSNLFGDEVGKRLKDINEINKINKNITSSYGRNSNYRGSFRGRSRFLGRRGYQPRQSYQSPRGQLRGNRPNTFNQKRRF